MVLRGRIEHPPYLVLEEEKNFKFNITSLLIYCICENNFFFKN